MTNEHKEAPSKEGLFGNAKSKVKIGANNCLGYSALENRDTVLSVCL